MTILDNLWRKSAHSAACLIIKKVEMSNRKQRPLQTFFCDSMRPKHFKRTDLSVNEETRWDLHMSSL